MLEVFLMRFSFPRSHMDRYIVHVYHYASFVDHVSKYGVHHGLESCRQVGEAKEHDCGFV